MEQQTPPEETQETTGQDADAKALPDEQPETTETESAESDQATQDAPTSDDSDDDEVTEWAKSQNLDLSDPQDVKQLAKRFRHTQGELRSRPSQDKLRKQVSEIANKEPAEENLDPYEAEQAQLRKEVNALRLENSVTRFFSENPSARELEDRMAQVVTEKPWLANDLDSLYIVAKSTNEDAIKSAEQKGRQDALNDTAAKQRASAPQASASQQQPKRKITREWVASLSPEEYRQNKDEILDAMKSGNL